MKVVTLLENNSIREDLLTAHGLSLYIEAHGKKILFDLGPNLFYKKNAKKMDIDLTAIDYLIISHGHYDHGLSLQKFMKKNKYTKVFLSVHAFDQHMKKNDKKYDFIGIEEPKNKKNIQFIDGNFNITEDIRIYTNVPYKKQIISDNHLFVLQNDMYLEDSFEHEIYLVINEDENCVLFSGCSHKGIENIIDSLEENNQLEFTHVIGGFHFSHYDSFNIKQTDYLINLGSKFGNRKNTSFYTGHCTGEEAYLELRQKMRDNLYKLNTGVIINI